MVECSFIYSKFHDGFVSDRWGLVSVLFDCKKELKRIKDTLKAEEIIIL